MGAIAQQAIDPRLLGFATLTANLHPAPFHFVISRDLSFRPKGEIFGAN